jgi:hypothetical protein
MNVPEFDFLKSSILSMRSRVYYSNNTKFIKGFIIIISIFFLMLNNIYGIVMPNTDIDCIRDYAFESTESINKFLENNVYVKKRLILFSSLMIDVQMLLISYFWVFKFSSWRVFNTICIFYIFRGIIQSLFQFCYPEGYLWEYPGVPSITVSYLKTNDFFFSGHVGLPVIIGCEFFKNDYFNLGVFAFLTCFVEFVTMIVTRGHYIIDLITGVLFAHYIYMIVDRYTKDVDDVKNSNNETALIIN